MLDPILGHLLLEHLPIALVRVGVLELPGPLTVVAPESALVPLDQDGLVDGVGAPPVLAAQEEALAIFVWRGSGSRLLERGGTRTPSHHLKQTYVPYCKGEKLENNRRIGLNSSAMELHRNSGFCGRFGKPESLCRGTGEPGNQGGKG